MNKRNFFARLTYAIICNLFMSFLINITGSLLVSVNIDWEIFFINWPFSFYIGVFVSMFVPLVSIGKWFTARFGVDNKNYTGNIKYRLLASLVITLIYFIILNPTVVFIDFFLVGKPDGLQYFISWLWQAPIMLVTSYIYSIGSDYVAYHTAHLIDKEF